MLIGSLSDQAREAAALLQDPLQLADWCFHTQGLHAQCLALIEWEEPEVQALLSLIQQLSEVDEQLLRSAFLATTCSWCPGTGCAVRNRRSRGCGPPRDPYRRGLSTAPEDTQALRELPRWACIGHDARVETQAPAAQEELLPVLLWVDMQGELSRKLWTDDSGQGDVAKELRFRMPGADRARPLSSSKTGLASPVLVGWSLPVHLSEALSLRWTTAVLGAALPQARGSAAQFNNFVVQTVQSR